MANVKLGDICHCRAGDKGDISNLGLIVYDQKDYSLVREKVTAGGGEGILQGDGNREGYPLRIATARRVELCPPWCPRRRLVPHDTNGHMWEVIERLPSGS